MSTFRNQAIKNLYAEVCQILPNGESSDKDGNIIDVNQDTLQAEINRLQTEYDSSQYQRDRAAAHKPIEEQLDMIYWDKKNGTNNWETYIDEIKTKYPKN